MVVKCYIVQGDQSDQMFTWWRIEDGSDRNVGRYIISFHTTVGEPGPLGAPQC